MKKNGFVPLIVLILITVLVVGGVVLFYSKNPIKETVLYSPSPTPTPLLNIINTPTTKPAPTIPSLKSISVSGFVYEDRNNDGLFNSDDPALPNMQMFFYDSYSPKDQISTVFSDSKGNFSITLDVRSGIIVHPTAYNNFVPKTGDKKVVSTSTGLQFGFRSASAPVPNQNIGIIEGNVFQDANRNLVRDSGENPVYFLKLYLQDSQGNYFNTVENAQTTDAGGHFKFTNLPVPTTYTIRLSNDTGEYEILREQTQISLTSINSQNTDVEIPVYKY